MPFYPSDAVKGNTNDGGRNVIEDDVLDPSSFIPHLEACSSSAYVDT